MLISVIPTMVLISNHK